MSFTPVDSDGAPLLVELTVDLVDAIRASFASSEEIDLSLANHAIESMQNLNALSLSVLDLTGNKLTQLHGLHGQHRLRELLVSRNLISQIEPVDFSLPALQTLDLSYNRISSESDVQALYQFLSHACPNLRMLRVVGNTAFAAARHAQFALEAFRALPHLEFVDDQSRSRQFVDTEPAFSPTAQLVSSIAALAAKVDAIKSSLEPKSESSKFESIASMQPVGLPLPASNADQSVLSSAPALPPLDPNLVQHMFNTMFPQQPLPLSNSEMPNPALLPWTFDPQIVVPPHLPVPDFSHFNMPLAPFPNPSEPAPHSQPEQHSERLDDSYPEVRVDESADFMEPSKHVHFVNSPQYAPDVTILSPASSSVSGTASGVSSDVLDRLAALERENTDLRTQIERLSAPAPVVVTPVVTVNPPEVVAPVVTAETSVVASTSNAELLYWRNLAQTMATKLDQSERRCTQVEDRIFELQQQARSASEAERTKWQQQTESMAVQVASAARQRETELQNQANAWKSVVATQEASVKSSGDSSAALLEQYRSNLFETLLENARLEEQIQQQTESAKIAADSSAQQVHRLQVQLAAVESDRQVAARREQEARSALKVALNSLRPLTQFLLDQYSKAMNTCERALSAQATRLLSFERRLSFAVDRIASAAVMRSIPRALTDASTASTAARKLPSKMDFIAPPALPVMPAHAVAADADSDAALDWSAADLLRSLEREINLAQSDRTSLTLRLQRRSVEFADKLISLSSECDSLRAKVAALQDVAAEAQRAQADAENRKKEWIATARQAAEEEWKSHRSSLEERCAQAESAAAKALKESIKDSATARRLSSECDRLQAELKCNTDEALVELKDTLKRREEQLKVLREQKSELQNALTELEARQHEIAVKPKLSLSARAGSASASAESENRSSENRMALNLKPRSVAVAAKPSPVESLDERVQRLMQLSAAILQEDN